ncbi:MAG: DHHA1 domain-containing protein, partial [Bacteroidota bacterium]
ADRLRLLGYSISEKLEVFPEHATSLISLSAEELKRFNFQRGDTEGVVNYALSVSGTTMAALITEQDNLIKLSLRSKGGFDVNTLARKHFEGGGHKNAAGGRSRLTFAETVDAFKALLPEYSAQLNQA